MAAGDGQLVDRHDAPARTAGRRPAAGERQAPDPGGDDPAVDDADAAGHGSLGPVEHRRRRAETGVRGDDRVLGVEDQRPVRVDELGQAALDRPVGRQRAVSIEVIRGDVGIDGHRRAPREGRQLQLGQLVHDAVARVSGPTAARPADRRCCRPGPRGATGRRRAGRGRGRPSWSCPWCPSRPRSAPGRGAGTGRAPRSAREPSDRRPRGARPARPGPPAAAARSSGSPG